MTRTIISLSESDKHWLIHQAEKKHTTMTAIVRLAVQRYREEMQRQYEPDSFKMLLKKTAGIWESGEGLGFQQKLRDEWESK